MNTNKLFAFYLGGSHPEANIEMHNMQFALGINIEDCFEQLVSDWYKDSTSVHIDSWAELSIVNGYNIEVVEKQTQKSDDSPKLFMVHMGAVLEGFFEEVHHTEIVAAKTESKALVKVRNNILKLYPNWKDIHRDILFDLDDIINLSNKFNLKITKSENPEQTYKVHNIYKKIK